MTAPYEVRAIFDDAELEAYGRMMGWSFAVPAADVAPWVDRAGRDNLRVAVGGGETLGGLALIPMGQFFGGRSLAMTGVGGVAIGPEYRGRGVAKALMKGAVEELLETEVALSVLYPATCQLYRAVGYELAGSRFRISVAASDVGVRERSVRPRPIEPSDDEAIRAAYRRFAAMHPGSVDRTEYLWSRIRSSSRSPTVGYVVEAGDDIEGYLYVSQKRTHGFQYDLEVGDLVALTSRAGRSLLDLLASHGTLAGRITWGGGPANTLLGLLPENRIEVALTDHWMLRLVDVPRALEGRGYAPTVRGRLELDVADDVLPGNAGRYILEVEDGAARVTRGGSGTLQVDVRGLASLFTGFRSARALALIGQMRADDDTLEQATGLFAGPAPSMSDRF